MANNFWSSDKIVSITAILISVGTLFVLIYQTNLMSEQKQQSVLPYLLMGYHNTGTPTFKVMVENKGVGPAFVESTTIYHKDSAYQMDIPTFLYNKVAGMDSIRNVYHSNIFEGLLIPAGQGIPILEVDNSRPDADRLVTLLRDLNNEKFRYELIYRSIYNERWMLSSESYVPKKLD